MRLTCAVIGWGILAPALLLSACKQGEGDRCNWNDDCSEGLICCVTPENRVKGGVCVLPMQCDLTDTDSGVTPADSGLDGKVTPNEDTTTADDAAADLEADQSLAPDVALPADLAPDTTPTPDVTPTPDQTPADSAAE